MYLTFERYQAFGGNLQKPLFDRFVFGVSKYIDYITNGRLGADTEPREAVERLCFELVEMQAEIDKMNGSGTVSSVSNDGVSINYVTSQYAGLTTVEIERIKYGFAKHYLMNEVAADGEFLMYRGV